MNKKYQMLGSSERTKFNPADALTKVGKWDALEQITITGVCDLPVEQWIVRAKQHE
jgi:hypothetical protein